MDQKKKVHEQKLASVTFEDAADRWVKLECDWPFLHNVTSSIHQTFRVSFADVTWTRFQLESSVMCIDDVDDLAFVTSENGRLILTRRRSKYYNVHVYKFFNIICSLTSCAVRNKFSYRRETTRQLCMSSAYLGGLTDRAMQRTPRIQRLSVMGTNYFKSS